MRTKVTEQGIFIPKRLLEGVEEVEIRKERDVILLVPVGREDPVLELGERPVTVEEDDASANHDSYLYGR